MQKRRNSDGQNITASYLEWRDDGVVEAGQNARKTFGINPRVVGRFKSEMGTNKTYEIDGNSWTYTGIVFVPEQLGNWLSETVSVTGKPVKGLALPKGHISVGTRVVIF